MRVRGRDRGVGSGQVEVADIAGVILVHTQEVMCLDVARIIDAQHHASTKLMLDAYVHLHRTRRFVVGVKQGVARREEVGEPGPDKGGIGRLQVQGCPCLKGRRQCEDRRQGVANQWEGLRTGGSAHSDCRRASRIVYRTIYCLQGCWRSGSRAGWEKLQERTRSLAGWAIKEHVVPD